MKIVKTKIVTASACDVKKPETRRPTPNYLNHYRMSDDELKGIIQNTIDYYTMKAENGDYTVNTNDLIMIELVRRELERKEGVESK